MGHDSGRDDSERGSHESFPISTGRVAFERLSAFIITGSAAPSTKAQVPTLPAPTWVS